MFRPITDIGLQKMKQWLENESWDEIASINCANQKAEKLQGILMNKYFEYFPEKSRIISSDSQPFYTDKLSRLKRKKSREYNKLKDIIKRK